MRIVDVYVIALSTADRIEVHKEAITYTAKHWPTDKQIEAG